MIEKLRLRINELAAKNKAHGLTQEEIAEREELRNQYLQEFREGMQKNILDNVYIVDDDGNKTKLEKKKNNAGLCHES